MVTVEQLRRIMPHCPHQRAAKFCIPLNEAMAAYEITTPERQAAFIAQLAVVLDGAGRFFLLFW